jgi:hypothetical protein
VRRQGHGDALGLGPRLIGFHAHRIARKWDCQQLLLRKCEKI